MVEHTYRLLHLFNESGEISGRKRLQKMFYIIQSLGYDFDLEYSYQRYGPYSSQLQLETNMLVDEGLVKEQFDKRMYSYTVTENGKVFLRKLEDGNLLEAPQVPREVINTLKQRDAQLLELASTIMYLAELGLEKERAYEKLGELKPHLMNRHTEAVDFIKDIDRFKNARL